MGPTPFSGVAVARGLGGGAFDLPLRVELGGAPSALVAADADADGIPDLLVLGRDAGVVHLLRGKPGGAFEAPVAYPVRYNPSTLHVGDFDGDAARDVAVAAYEPGNAGVPQVNLLLQRCLP